MTSNSIFLPSFCYQSQTWPLCKAQEQQIVTCEMRCLRKVINVTRRDRMRCLRKVINVTRRDRMRCLRKVINVTRRDRMRCLRKVINVTRMDRMRCLRKVINVTRRDRMRCLRKVINVTRRDRLREEKIRKSVGTIPCIKNIEMRKIKWFGHLIKWRLTNYHSVSTPNYDLDSRKTKSKMDNKRLTEPEATRANSYKCDTPDTGRRTESPHPFHRINGQGNYKCLPF
jgi:hypothetical protein